MEQHTAPSHIAGVAVEDLATLAGTPVYVYDQAIIARQVRRLQNAFADTPTRFMYACKALPNLAIMKLVKRLGTGLDTVDP